MLVKVEQNKEVDFGTLKQGETFYYGGGYLMKIGAYRAVDLASGDTRALEYESQVVAMDLMVIKKPNC